MTRNEFTPRISYNIFINILRAVFLLSVAIKIQTQTKSIKRKLHVTLLYEKDARKIMVKLTPVVQPSISSTLYARIFHTKVSSKLKSKQRKDFRTKNARVKC